MNACAKKAANVTHDKHATQEHESYERMQM